MAETAQQHQPAFERDRQLSTEQFPFLKSTDQLDSEAGNPSIPKTASQKGGRPPLSSYLEPSDTPELAFNAQKIEENYPFFGTLLKRENGLYRRKEAISKSEPKDIEYVKGRYGAGAYQLRQKRDTGEEQKINFNVSGIERAEPGSSTQEKVIDQEFIAGLRRELKQEIRSDYESEIERMERRLERQNGELDEYASKVRNLTVELAETDRQSARSARQELKEFEQQVDKLKEEKRDLEFEVFELEQELKYSGADGGFDLKSMLKDALENPDVMKILAPVIAKLFGGEVQQAPPNAALNGTVQEQPATDNGQYKTQAKNPQQQHETEQKNMQYLVNQFSASVIQNATSSMIHGNPSAGDLKKVVMQNVRDINRQGLELQPAMWIQICKALIEVALQNEVPAEKAAQTIMPILEQFDGAANQLKYIPAAGAAEYLINRFNITDINAEQKRFLIEVLKVFKKTLKQAS